MPERSPKLRPKLEIVDIIARLEAITNSATKLPLTRRAVINPREIQELVTQVRSALPTDINEALQIIRYRDTIISQAQADANRTRAKAEQEAMQKVSEAQVMRDAQAKAKEIVAEAEKERQALMVEAEKQAAARVQGADQYALEVLSRLEEEMNTLLQTTRRGIESLKEGKALDEDPSPE